PFGQGLGVETTDHDVPSHRSASVTGKPPTKSDPTAQASVEESAETSASEVSEGGFGLGASDHRPPSQCSASVPRAAFGPGSSSPTDHTSSVDTTETLASSALCFQNGSALGTMDHAEPSQCSVRVWMGPL